MTTTTLTRSNHKLLSENHPTGPSSSSKEEGIQAVQKVTQESQENNQKFANTWKEQEIEALAKHKAAAVAIVGNSLQRILQINPATATATQFSFKMRESYLPVATSSRRGSKASDTKGASPRIASAEQEYNRMFNAPSLIEVHQKAISDDGVTEVSEITTDIRTRSLRGASYAERRMAGKLQKLREQNLPTSPAGFRLPQHDEEEELELSNSYVEGDVGDLKHLMQKVEKAKQNLQQAGPVVRRHGLPYEATDFRTEGDDEYSIDPWDGAIRGTSLRIQSPRRDSVEPKDGDVICVQGPPTPRNRPCPENLHNLIRETISSEGDMVIDATDVCDEDLDGVTVLTDSKHQRIRVSDSKTVGTSVLFGEVIIDAEDPTLISDIDARQPTKRDFAEAVLASKTEPPASVKTATTSGYTTLSGYDSTINDVEDDSSILVQADKHKGEGFASDIVNSSFALFKSFASQVETQLEIIQSRGLISETDMDGVLGILERDMHEASERVPMEGGDMMFDFGEELEMTTCGATQAIIPSVPTLPSQSRDVALHQSHNVESMLDSLKVSYKAGLSNCGVDKNLIKDNTKAMEDMMANLKQAYQDSTPGCGVAARDDILVSAAIMDKQESGVSTSKTINVLNDAASKASSLRDLVKQIQEAKSVQMQEGNNADKSRLKKESAEAVDDMFKKAREACSQKSIKLGKLKKRRAKQPTAKAPEPQTFIVPINMPRRASATPSNNISSQPVSKGYSEIE